MLFVKSAVSGAVVSDRKVGGTGALSSPDREQHNIWFGSRKMRDFRTPNISRRLYTAICSWGGAKIEVRFPQTWSLSGKGRLS